MAAFPSVVQSSLGHTFHLAKQIGKGGEGAIYETAEQKDIAIKLYWPDKAASRREKISAMAAAQWYKTNSFVAFPIDVLFSPNGSFVGFAMKKIGGSRPVHMLYSPASRKLEFSRANYKFLIRAAANIARAVASVHATGCVIGDVNHSGVLVSDQATSILIDSDSFQVIAANQKFLCQVGTPEYTPPELQGERFDRVTRTPNHDNFGLAVLIFQILFMGRHPFSGRYQGVGEMPLERAIGEYRFAYSPNTARTRMEPPPGAPFLTDFPPFVGQAFETSFGLSGRSARVTASDWVNLLETLETYLVQCTADRSHQHIKGLPCPWCRMEQVSPGFIAFNPVGTTPPIPIHVDVSQLAAFIRAIRDPGPTPNIQTVIVLPAAMQPAIATSSLLTSMRRRAYLGIGASAAGAVLISFGSIAIIPGVLALASGALVTAIAPRELRKLREARSQADAAWRLVEDAWSKQPSNTNFMQIKSELSEQVRLLTDLPAEEKRQLQKLEQSKRETQLKRHLDCYLIANAKIAKIGSGRKAVLASFGIQTAGDIDTYKISAIQGFGPALVSSLMAWRQGVANKFIFNAGEPINPNDLAAVKTRIVNRKVELDGKIRVAATNLQQASNFALAQRNKLTASANQAFVARKQAELNERGASGPLHKASKFISFCCIGLAAIALVTHHSTTDTKFSNGPSVVTEHSTASLPPQLKPPVQAHKTAVAPVLLQPGIATAQQIEPENSEKSPPNPTPRQEQVMATALPPPRDIPPAPSPFPDLKTEGGLQRGISKPEDIAQIQRRLIELGYLVMPESGKWGPLSRKALAEFKEQAGLEKNDSWNLETEHSLFNDGAPYAMRTLQFIGGWTPERGQCGSAGEPPPLRITADRAESDGGFCEFNSVKREGSNSWRIEAKCSVDGSSHIAHIRLAVKDQILQWTSEQPQELYYRCGNSR